MNHESPWPPHLQSFIREQIASGRFQSEGDVVLEGLRLLEEQSHWAVENADWLKQELDKGLSSRPSEPITTEFWTQIRQRLQATQAVGDDR